MREEKIFCVYIMMNRWNTTSYIGVTSKLLDRVLQHKQKLVQGFTQKYQLSKLVYYEVFDTAEAAIRREKELKGWVRKKKVELIKSKNPTFRDLSDDFFKGRHSEGTK